MEKKQPGRITNRYKKIWREKGIPGSAFLELTPRCTLDCKMCYVHLRPDQMGGRKELSTEQWIRLIDEAAEAGMLFAVLTGGECMLHPGFWEIYDHLLDLGVIVTVNTNAYTISEADFARFLQRPPSAFRVTLYGASEEGYARCTGVRAYQRVLDNVVRLRDAGIHVVLAVTLTPWNKDEFVDTCLLGRSLGLPTSCVIDLTAPNEDTGRSLEEISLSSADQVEQLKKLRLAGGGSLCRNEPISEIPPLMPDDPSCKGMRCSAGTDGFVIRWDGAMVPCFDFNYRVPVLELGFRAAWEEIRKAAKECRLPVECMHCRLLSVCADCPFEREDPKNPGHRSAARCRITIDRYNAGLCRLHPEPGQSPDEDLMPGRETC